MQLYLCAIVTLVEMLDMNFISSITGKLMQVFAISYTQLSILYISLSLGACISLPLTKYLYNSFNLKILYQILLIILIINFSIAFFTKNWNVFCVLRMIQGFCLTLLYSLSFLDIANSSIDKEKDFNLINGISILGSISGPALNGIMTLIGWNYIFLVFIMILSSLFYFIYNIDFFRTTIRSKIKFFDILEYLNFVLVLSIGSLILDGSINLYYLPLAFILGVVLIIKYKKCSVNFIFNKNAFNKTLLNVSLIHLFSRLSLVGLIPLLATTLYKDYNYSILKISLLITTIGIGSLFAKIAYKNFALFRFHKSKIFYIYMGILTIFAFSPFKHFNILTIILIMFGFISSIVFNYVNNCIFFNAEKQHLDDLSVILTILQMLLYGLCTSLVFKLYAVLEHTINVQAALAITILLMVYSIALTSKIYSNSFNHQVL